jgi:hypothetical protein
MREICNTGYGRHGCEQFPTSSAADAIRFHVVQDQGALIQIQYVFEKACWPAERGTLDYDTGRGFSSSTDTTLSRQAEAYIESYLRRRDLVNTGSQA